MSVQKDWIDAAVEITPGFETVGDPYAAVSGDFDGMGISCGALQWNIGMGSLQTMVIGIGRDAVRSVMPQHGAALWEVCSAPIKQGLLIVRGWQNGARLRAGPKAELAALMASPAMRAQQQARIAAKAETAFSRARDWSMARDGTEPSKRLFLWFFDVVTQNGGLEGLTPARVAEFIRVNRPDRVDDIICDFLASRKGPSGHVRDAHANAALWRDQALGEKLEMLCMSYLRSGTANPKWRHVVLNRKGTIAMGRGSVNGGAKMFGHLGI